MAEIVKNYVQILLLYTDFQLIILNIIMNTDPKKGGSSEMTEIPFYLKGGFWNLNK